VRYDGGLSIHSSAPADAHRVDAAEVGHTM